MAPRRATPGRLEAPSRYANLGLILVVRCRMRWVVRITLACPEGVIHRQVQRVLIVVMMRMVMSMDMTSVVRMAAMSQNHRARVLVVRQMQRHYERLHDQANRHQHSEELRKRRVACS
jgi:Leu/Phe-tRNA-protein transferase